MHAADNIEHAHGETTLSDAGDALQKVVRVKASRIQTQARRVLGGDDAAAAHPLGLHRASDLQSDDSDRQSFICEQAHL